MSNEKDLILTASQVSQKIRRIAYEIYEHNFREDVIIIAGIDGQGYELAHLIADELRAISPIKPSLVKVSLNKANPLQSEVTIDCDLSEVRKKCIILVDDVLNTGRTLAYSLKPFLDTEIKKVEIAVLVNRSHTLFPLSPEYTGYELATTINDHVVVTLGEHTSVYLS